MIPGTPSESSLRMFAERYYAEEKAEAKPADVFSRVSGGNKEYFDLMNALLFLPNSPTLFNLGLDNGCTSSACFVFDVADTLRDGPNSIMATQEKAVAVAKAGGGVGYYFGNLRRKGAKVRSVNRTACGPVKVLRHYHSIRNLVKQGSKRDLAQMGVLDETHPDIEEWTTCKVEDPSALESFNISNSWRNERLNTVDFSLDPEEGIRSKHDATRHWWMQCKAAWGCGCPGMLFWDTINAHNATPHVGDINATNPCGETPNINDEPCNLGSLAICRFLRKVDGVWDLDWESLRDYVRLCIRFLDDILDWNRFPLPAIHEAAHLTRKLGLGVMGLADLFAIMGIPYASKEAVGLSAEIAAFIQTNALIESIALAKAKGPYPAWETGTPATQAKFVCARNSTRTSIAPTGTISILADVWGGIEPYFAVEASRVTYEGIRLPAGVPAWVRFHLPPGHQPQMANEIPYSWHVEHQAAWQKNVDLGVSKTINMPESATVRDISEAYKQMWQSGCKGGTIYRDNCRPEQVIRKKSSVYMADAEAEFVPLPDDVECLPRHKFYAGNTKCYLHVGTNPEKTRPLEVFLRVSNVGSTLNGMFESWAKNLSIMLQRGVPLEDVVKTNQGIRFEPAGMTRNKEIPVCTSIVDYVAQFLDLKFGKKGTDSVKATSGQFCPECGSEAFYQSGCLTCSKCLWSRCG